MTENSIQNSQQKSFINEGYQQKKILSSKRIRDCYLSEFKEEKLEKNSKKKLSRYDDEETCSKSLPDLYSDTSSTTNSSEEETPDKKNIEIKNYKKELEIILKKIQSQNLNINFQKLLTNEKNLEESLNEIVSKMENNKINIVLDIDQTLVFSQKITDPELIKNYQNKFQNFFSNSHLLEISTIDGKKIYFNVQVRKNLTEFLQNIQNFCNFYINTMASPLYVNAVLTLLYQKYNLRLSNSGKNNVIITKQNQRKTLPAEIAKDGNFLILDDNLFAWDTNYITSIIPVKKFFGNFEKTNNVFYDTVYQYYLFTNKVYCFDEIKRNFFDKKNNLLYCAEASWSEISQLNYIAEVIKKSYLLSKLSGIPLRFSLRYIINNILNGVKIYYDGVDKEFIEEIINLLGGQFVKDINEAMIILSNGENKQEDKINNNILNVKWIFDCFFYFKKCDTNLEIYQEGKYLLID